jgi:hypothetical protein
MHFKNELQKRTCKQTFGKQIKCIAKRLYQKGVLFAGLQSANCTFQYVPLLSAVNLVVNRIFFGSNRKFAKIFLLTFLSHPIRDQNNKTFTHVINGSFTLAKFVKQNCLRHQHTTVTTVLALATLGGVTQIGSFLFYVVPLKVAKASTVVTVTCCCRQRFCKQTLPM